jgi:hypothetical protein
MFLVSVLFSVAACATVQTPSETEPVSSRDQSSVDHGNNEPAGQQAGMASGTARTAANEESAPAAEANPKPTAVVSAKDAESEDVMTEPVAVAEPDYLLVRVERMLPSGVIDSVRKIVRDPATGRVVSETYGVPDAKRRNRTEYDYTVDGVVRITRFAEDGTVESSTVRSYDGNALVKELQLDSRGEVSLESIYRYEDGRIAAWSLFDAEGVPMSVSEYDYEGSRLIRTDNYDGGGVLQDYLVCAYDDGGRCVSETLFDARDGSTLFVTRYEYDELGRRSASFETGLGLNREIRYEYDDNDNLTSEAVYGPRSRMLYVKRYAYEVPISSEADDQ